MNTQLNYSTNMRERIRPNSKTRIVPHYEIKTEKDLNRQKILWNACARTIIADYQYTDFNKPVIINLLYYINGIEREYDLNKGLLISGSFGVGKTVLFRILHKYCCLTANPNIFRIESVETLKNHFMEQKNFNFYNEFKPNSGKHGINLCINEFGIDYDASMFGVKYVESLNAFLMQRYELFESKNLITHATTNMNSTDYVRKYDAALSDRFKAMFNIISLGGKSYRK